ncbi:hypothetical protein A2634_00945 [Candidatus Amesbacteria bacterium RIFCSPHIGHO2_01_FULL_48_32]|uniref:Nudix hydrolase domain-containing protein n=1 Tax=Candidatus Amesbacteria bacterium RIFCSPLOWO2_01_FULL_48_25 TaxID=1797259 RepID=A0A1F4ZAT0_9BACT|nr:MAG: hypothetical protein A2634_00945 [Candidatus Amesbacteria bacterium RIFCSPHIGHO2_01_FULL_48_32]OGD03373.1 MAG: hypothetical protein A2989_00895 [Candidatus Amesbacteria bacterium RIFCSPLOWO2_01_FULL_48_25]HJZ04801.1 NUDIX hydrolase [Patescibacteria group bacterium]
MNLNELKEFLNSRKIPYEEWGTGESKTLAHLLTEIRSGEVKIEDSGKKVLRSVKGVGINVFFSQGQGVLKLVEEKQVFSDGRERRRSLSTSIGEKMRPGELPDEAAIRTLKEELGIIGVALFNTGVEDREQILSTSYPGLWSKYKVYIYETRLSPYHFRPEGYVEVQDDKTSYFIWQPI